MHVQSSKACAAPTSYMRALGLEVLDIDSHSDSVLNLRVRFIFMATAARIQLTHAAHVIPRQG